MQSDRRPSPKKAAIGVLIRAEAPWKEAGKRISEHGTIMQPEKAFATFPTADPVSGTCSHRKQDMKGKVSEALGFTLLRFQSNKISQLHNFELHEMVYCSQGNGFTSPFVSKGKSLQTDANQLCVNLCHQLVTPPGVQKLVVSICYL